MLHIFANIHGERQQCV